MDKHFNVHRNSAVFAALAMIIFPNIPAARAGVPNIEWGNVDLDFPAKKASWRVISNSVLIQNESVHGRNHFSDSSRIKLNSVERASSQSHLWALACPALQTIDSKQRNDVLWCVAATPANIAAERKALAEGWGINSRRDLLAHLNWISAGGHRLEFEQMYKLSQSNAEVESIQAKLKPKSRAEFEQRIAIVREYAPKFGVKSLKSWDFCRYIELCRWGALCGYISPDEAWARIMPAAQLLQNTFSSWQDLGKNFLVGRRYWQPESEQQAAFENCYKNLLSDPQSPWVRIPWETKLSAK